MPPTTQLSRQGQLGGCKDERWRSVRVVVGRLECGCSWEGACLYQLRVGSWMDPKLMFQGRRSVTWVVARLKAFNFCRWGKRRKARGPIGGRKPVRSLGLGAGLEVLPLGGEM